MKGVCLCECFIVALSAGLSRLAKFDGAQTEQIELWRKSGRALYCFLKHSLSDCVSQMLMSCNHYKKKCTGAAFMKVIKTN